MHPVGYAGVGLFAYIVLLFCDWFIGRGSTYIVPALGEHFGPILYIGAASLLIFGMAASEIASPKRRNAIVALLGGASYTLYLFHGVMTSVVIRGIRSALPRMGAGVAFPILVAIAVFGAIFVHLAIETPTLSIFRPKLAPRANKA